MDRLLIRDKAREILDINALTSAPIDVNGICLKEQIKVHCTSLVGLEDQTSRPISGLIYVDKKTKRKMIFVNDKDIEPRRNFTIAHELGHYFLHIPDDDNGVIISFRGLKNEREREADIFASELLMPKNLVKEEYDKLPFPTVSYLASLFNVSKMAMEIKLQEMELDYIG